MQALQVGYGMSILGAVPLIMENFHDALLPVRSHRAVQAYPAILPLGDTQQEHVACWTGRRLAETPAACEYMLGKPSPAYAELT